MDEFVLDASFALRWCFEDETSAATESVLARLAIQTAAAWVPPIWRHELLNGLGKGIVRERLLRDRALEFWREIRELPIRLDEIPADERLLELALTHNLSVYDASYLRLAISRELAIATGDSKLQQAALRAGLKVIYP